MASKNIFEASVFFTNETRLALKNNEQLDFDEVTVTYPEDNEGRWRVHLVTRFEHDLVAVVVRQFNNTIFHQEYGLDRNGDQLHTISLHGSDCLFWHGLAEYYAQKEGQPTKSDQTASV